MPAASNPARNDGALMPPVEVVEDGDRGAPTKLVDHFLQIRLQNHFRIDGAQVSRADGEYLWPQQEPSAGAADIAKQFERVQ